MIKDTIKEVIEEMCDDLCRKDYTGFPAILQLQMFIVNKHIESEKDKLRGAHWLASIANRLIKVLDNRKNNETYSVLDELADFEAIAKDAREIMKGMEVDNG